MANAHTNKVVLGNEVLIDLTGDTVNAASILSGKTAHDKSGANITGNYVPFIEFTNKTVAVSAWASDATYEVFPYIAAIPCTGATADMFAYVEFNSTDADSRNFCAECKTYAGGVYIYAESIPANSITISKITFYKRS